MGVLDEFGTIESGKKADLVIFNEEYEMESVVLNGIKLV
jgi:N-acetylglucosamine-6-phosphate deacetylase